MISRAVVGFAFGAIACAAIACAPPANAPIPPARKPALAIVDDDYARALADARAAHRPIVAVSGAAWCDPCREMRAVVLEDPRLAAHARDFTWLSIDVERDENAAFVARFASEALPVVWVIDTATEDPAIAWRGSASVRMVEQLAQIGADAIRGRDPGGDPEAALWRGLRADASGERDRALAEYRLATDKGAGATRALAVTAAVALLSDRDRSACADLAAREAPALPADLAAPVVAAGIECEARAPLVDLARKLVSDSSALAGDRSALWARIVATDARDAVAADARAWLAFLDAESAKAPSSRARASLDGARLAAHLALGEPDRAVAALARTERDLPRDYAAPAHLARAFAAAKRWDDALRAIDRALALAYGPHRVALLARKVDVQVGGGDAHAALRTLEEALTLARSLPLSGGYARLRATLEIRRAEWRVR